MTKNKRIIENNGKSDKKKLLTLPLISNGNMVLFPNTVVPILIKNLSIIEDFKFAKINNSNIFFIINEIDKNDKLEIKKGIGTIAKILHLIDLPNGFTKIFLEGVQRAEIIDHSSDFKKVSVLEISEDIELKKEQELEIQSLVRAISLEFNRYIIYNKIEEDLIKNITTIKDSSILADVLAFYIVKDAEKQQEILETLSTKTRLEKILLVLSEEIELQRIKKNIDYKIQSQMDKNQREVYLQEKIRHLKSELGEKNTADEIVEHYNILLLEKKLPKHVKEKIEEELEKLQFTPINGSEFGLIRSYLDLIFTLPWNESAKLETNIIKIKNYLEESHYGMEDLKKRIIEMIAIKIRGGTSKKNVLCLYGSPGTGKTSFAKSIAEALGREFVKISLGGIHDESEIRGHRRTYIGAMPGKIISAMKKAKVNNPVILMDEIDKISSNSRGDPVAALLEVLDPEQNQSFQDHYLDLEYDLSNAIFVATANSLDMSRPLLDRLEIIKVPSYLEEEKLKISQKYIIPKVMKETGLTEDDIEIQEDAIKEIIKYYTREAGLRNLERQTNKIFRKVNLELLETEIKNKDKKKTTKKSKKIEQGIYEESEVLIEENLELKASINQESKLEIKLESKKISINSKNLSKYLGIKKYSHEFIENKSMVGIINGLAYSESGGDILILESVAVPGKGEIKCTGTLGDVMKESVQIAFTFIKSRTEELSLNKDFFKENDIHLHVPDGSTPKDGPSAGVAISLAIYSTISGKKIKNTVAMTGEISLRGKILPIGGLREKLTSAVRSGVKEVIIPNENEKDLEEIPDFIKKKLKIHKLGYFNQVLDIAVEN